MVKNTKGGSRNKALARKDVNISHKNNHVPSNPFERYAQVVRLLGNGMCHVSICNQLDHSFSSPPNELICHIRGAFRGKNKRSNLVEKDSFIVVLLREWENPSKNCDLIAILHNHSSHNLHSNPIELSTHNLHHDITDINDFNHDAFLDFI
jgi:hypothetical protein